MPSLIEEVRDRLDVPDDTIEVIERWLTCELARHVSRVEKVGWRSPTERRRITGEQLGRLFTMAARDIAPIVEELRRLGFTVPEPSIENAIYAVGRGDAAAGKAAAELLRSTHIETHAALRQNLAETTHA